MNKNQFLQIFSPILSTEGQELWTDVEAALKTAEELPGARIFSLLLEPNTTPTLYDGDIEDDRIGVVITHPSPARMPNEGADWGEVSIATAKVFTQSEEMVEGEVTVVASDVVSDDVVVTNQTTNDQEKDQIDGTPTEVAVSKEVTPPPPPNTTGEDTTDIKPSTNNDEEVASEQQEQIRAKDLASEEDYSKQASTQSEANLNPAPKDITEVTKKVAARGEVVFSADAIIEFLQPAEEIDSVDRGKFITEFNGSLDNDAWVLEIETSGVEPVEQIKIIDTGRISDIVDFNQERYDVDIIPNSATSIPLGTELLNHDSIIVDGETYYFSKSSERSQQKIANFIKEATAILAAGGIVTEPLTVDIETPKGTLKTYKYFLSEVKEIAGRFRKYNPKIVGVEDNFNLVIGQYWGL